MTPSQRSIAIELLGPPTLRVDGRDVALEGRRQIALLTLLALNVGRSVSRDYLIDSIWSEDLPAVPSNALQARVSSLRRSLGPGVLLGERQGYRLALDPGAVDVRHFERLVANAEETLNQGDPRAAATLMRASLQLWRGQALDGLVEMEFARTEAQRLEELRAHAVEACIEVELSLGKHTELVAELQALVHAYPTRERLVELLMLALYRAGRQADALGAFQAAGARLRDEYGLDPNSSLRDMELAILRQEAALNLPAISPGPGRAYAAEARSGIRGNIPGSATSFVGREREVEQVRELLRSARVVTLFGTGGTGKTRLALEVAALEGAQCADGAWLVELGPIARPGHVAPAVLRALGVQEVSPAPISAPASGPDERLLDYFAAKELLLVLDNCEHLVSEVARLVELVVRRALGLRVLATSREALSIPGEVRLAVSPLAVPPAESGSLEHTASYAAVRLFLDRATALQPDFQLDAANTRSVADICRHLDGIPLALELAARQVRLLAPQQIANSLDVQFQSSAVGPRTTEPRHRTLQAAIDWSYDRLDAREQRLFLALSVFAGSFNFEAARELGAAAGLTDGEVVESLERLVDTSLIIANVHGAAARYRLLEPLRQYAADRLHAHQTGADLRRRHAEWYLSLAESWEPAVHGAHQPEAISVLVRELDNLRAAFAWAVEVRDGETARRLASALGWFHWLWGLQREGLAEVELALRVPPTAVNAAWARAAMWACHLAQNEHQPTMAVAFGQQSLEAYEQLGLGHSSDAALARSFYALALFRGDQREQAATVLARGIADAERTDDPWRLASCYIVEGLIALRTGRPRSAEKSFRRSLENYQVAGDGWGEHRVLFRLAAVAESQGKYAEAIAHCQASLDRARRLHLEEAEVARLAQLGRLVFLSGNSAKADALLSAAVERAAWLGAHEPAATAHHAMGLLQFSRGEYTTAIALHEQALEWLRRASLRVYVVEALTSQALSGFHLEGADLANNRLREAIGEAIGTDSAHAAAVALDGMAYVAARTGRFSLAAQMLGAAEACRDVAEVVVPSWLSRVKASTLEALAPHSLERFVEVGRRLAPAHAADVFLTG
jgi:predicted ATPase/DNA-binding SARP family transcriptional activator